MGIYDDYCKSLVEVCKDRKFAINFKRLSNGYKFYYININDRKEAKRSICFSAGIHGDEIAGPNAVLRYLSKFNPDIHLLIFPVANPYGFDREQRYNALKHDINRRFCDRLLVGEAKTVHNLIKKCQPDLFCSLHEWKAEDGYYMYASDKIQEETYLKIPKIADKHFKVFNNRKVNNEEVKQGIIWHPQDGYEDDRSRCTLENKVYTMGIHYLCIETPSKADLEDRVACQTSIIDFIVRETK